MKATVDVKGHAMSTTVRSCIVNAALAAPLLLTGAQSIAQDTKFARGADGGPPACSLIKGADVQKATGTKQSFPSEQYPYPQGGTICSVPGAELVVLSGADSVKRFDKLLESLRRKDEPRKSISGVGERAYAMYPKPRTSVQREHPQGLLVAQRGPYVVSLAVDVAPDKPVESIEPAMVSLMKTVLARLP
jgi:hypothetical protein